MNNCKIRNWWIWSKEHEERKRQVDFYLVLKKSLAHLLRTCPKTGSINISAHSCSTAALEASYSAPSAYLKNLHKRRVQFSGMSLTFLFLFSEKQNHTIFSNHFTFLNFLFVCRFCHKINRQNATRFVVFSFILCFHYHQDLFLFYRTPLADIVRNRQKIFVLSR